MDYKQAWNDLSIYLEEAVVSVGYCMDKRDKVDDTFFKLLGKRGGIETALEYMHQVTASLNEN